ncbi:MAG: tRNA lysidine(34) synthetase TilS [Syntrophaceae bacterium]|nr:tRNA lysidine(34) synthetase TilS [Syntrophaceae bacterium]
MVLEKVRRTIDRYHLLDRGDRVVVGVSAGVDSMVLLHVLNALRQEFDLSLIVAHVNHGIRVAESEAEAELVRRESQRLGLSFECGQFNAKEFQKARGTSLQDAARRIRFHFFNTLLRKYHANKIALGQNADDQVETVLIRLIRGSGLKGLKGMLPIREGRVIRPLLEVWRREIESFARDQKILYLLDSSNMSQHYLRNRIRLSLIPLIEREYQPNLKGILFKTSAILRSEDDYLERGAEEAYERIVQAEGEALSFRFSEYQSLHPAIQWRLLHKILERVCGDEMTREEGEGGVVEQVHGKLGQSHASFLMELPHRISLEKRYDLVLIKKGWLKPVPPFEVELLLPGRTQIKEIEKEVITEEISRSDGLDDFIRVPDIAFFDFESLRFPLKMRNFRPGDRFQPLGMKGTQKLKEFFIDHKVPKFERPRIPLLTSGEMIAWVVGYRIDERVKVTEKTQRILKIEVI